MLNLTHTTDPYLASRIPTLEEINARLLDHRGRSNSGRFTFKGGMSVMCDDDFPPDSVFWSLHARGAINSIANLLGDEYAEYAELTFPGETIREFSWRTICEMTEAALNLARTGERDVKKLASAAHESLENLIKKTRQ